MALTLTFEKRDPKKVKLNALRHGGKIPAVFYGRKQSSTPISVPSKEFQKVWKHAGESTVVTLSGPEEVEALIHEVVKDPVKDTVRHIDFYVFEKGQKLRVSVPIEFMGVAPAVKDQGGVLVKVLHALEVEAEPKNLPHTISVDISPLSTFESVIAAREIVLPAGVALITDPDEIVASVYEPKEEVVEEKPVDLSTIEVVKKGKEAKEGDAGEVSPAGSAPEGGKEAQKKEEKK